METRRLSEQDFAGTFAEPMRDVTADADPVTDIWPYVAAVPAADLAGSVIHDRFVEIVYRSADGRYDHVLVMTRTRNVYLAVVVDRHHDRVFGHKLLDLNREYGLQ